MIYINTTDARGASSPFQAILAMWNDWKAVVHVMDLVSAPGSARDICLAESLATDSP